jgi:hypothetical protein
LAWILIFSLKTPVAMDKVPFNCSFQMAEVRVQLKENRYSCAYQGKSLRILRHLCEKFSGDWNS